MQFIGQENAALDLQFQQEAAIIAQRYNAIMQSGLSDADKLTARADFLEAEYQLEMQYAQQKAELWWNNAQTYINFAQQMSTFAIQALFAEGEERDAIQNRMLASAIRFLAKALQNYMFAKAKEHLINAMAAAGYLKLKTTQAVAEMTIGAQMAAAWAAYFTAMSLNPYGGQAFIPAATAMSAAIAAFGVAGVGAAVTGATSIAAELAMAALWAAGGIAVGAIGESLAASLEQQGTGGQKTIGGAGGYTYTQPTTPTWEKAEEKELRPIVVNYYHYGHVVDHDSFAREIIPSIRKAVADGVH